MTLVDVRDMVVVHTALLREMRLAPGLVRDTAPGDAKRARTVSGHLSFVTGLLHHHHGGEDRLLWPKLQARLPEQLTPLVTTMESQHERLDGTLQLVQAALPGWARSADVAARDELAGHLQELHTLLVEHLDAEERHLLPLAAGALSEREWQEIGEAAVAATPKRHLLLLFGMLMYEGDPEVLTGMLATAPPLARRVLPLVAPRVYARYARRLYGTARP